MTARKLTPRRSGIAALCAILPLSAAIGSENPSNTENAIEPSSVDTVVSLPASKSGTAAKHPSSQQAVAAPEREPLVARIGADGQITIRHEAIAQPDVRRETEEPK